MAASVTRRKNGKRESWYFVRTQHSPEPVLKTRSARQLARRGGFARKALAAARTGLRAQRPTDVGMITSATDPLGAYSERSKQAFGRNPDWPPHAATDGRWHEQKQLS